MHAAVLREFGAPLTLEERPAPAARGEQVAVRVLGCGVCHTDLHICAGQYPELALPRVPGHEIAGEAEGVGAVLVYASWGCGACSACVRGEEQLCAEVAEAGWARDGGYAEQVLVPSRRYLLPLGDLDPVHAAPLADAGVTPFRAVRRVAPWLGGGARALVIGAGGLGQFAIQFLRLQGTAEIAVLDRSRAKLERALALGAGEVRLPGERLPEAQAVLDFVGSDETLALAAGCVAPGGVVVQVGEAQGRLGFGLGRVPHEAFFTSSIWGSLPDLRAVLDCARRGELEWQVEALPLERANEALHRLAAGGVAGRLVLVP